MITQPITDKPTHEVKITMVGKESRIFPVTGIDHYSAIKHALQQLFGDDKDQELPAFIVKCEKVEK